MANGLIRLGKLGVALSAIVSAAVLAQDLPTGSRLHAPQRSGTLLPAAQSARAATEMARCIEFKRPSAVRDYLLSVDPRLTLEKAAGVQVDCLSLFTSAPAANEMIETRRAMVPDDLLRGMLAEAQIRRLKPAMVGLDARKLQPTYARPWFAATKRNIAVDEMATCIAETNPSGVAALIGTEVMSAAEGAAFGALSANFGPCLRVGAKLQANRQSLRAALAEALFHRLYDPAPLAPPTPAPKVG